MHSWPEDRDGVVPSPLGMDARQQELVNPYLLSHQKVGVQSWSSLPVFGKDSPSIVNLAFVIASAVVDETLISTHYRDR